jgi:hypothetical protein
MSDKNTLICTYEYIKNLYLMIKSMFYRKAMLKSGFDEIYLLVHRLKI